ncbi:hypothetical protein ACFOTA_19150 [Chitinophaga sp. GCM10012297]|uniref:Uncharacterized protein n=1 Tax=Chitinophaga chungangae TaxID=2821488 RepID=A0ABS3YI26_9BACT|nr:hypothetical protein [Chitinophaga chungangae]MBO9154340.1 hypothetical protein [Chitinophaga chungangae]
MEYNNIRALLEKYWACETTEAEEAGLRMFYAAHEGPLPADLQEAAPMFRYFHAAGEGEAEELFSMPELFTDRPAPWETATKTEIKIIRPFWQGWMKYAAVLLAAAGIVYSINQHQVKLHGDATAFKDTYSDPKLAYEQTQRALQLLSRNLNKGKKEMEKLSYFNEAKGMVEGNRN